MPTLIQKQREMFDKEFPILLRPIKEDAHNWKNKFQFLFERQEGEVGDFITTCLIEHYEEDIRELEGSKQKLLKEFQENLLLGPDWYDGYNHAISDAISLLQDKIKQLKQ